MMMATRRSDTLARSNWQALLSALERNAHLEGLLIDRTEDGSAEQYAQDHGADLIRDERLTLVRQDHEAPVREIVTTWSDAPLRWTMEVHDDDHWQGVAKLPAGLAPGVSLYAPRLLYRRASDAPWTPMHRWTGQHALFGATAPYIQEPFLAYVRDEPMTTGGEDLLLLFLCMGLGKVEEMPGYTYFWDGSNWASDSATQTSTREYTRGFLAEEIGSTSAFILFQSLDRLAICSYLIDRVPHKTVRRMSRLALRTFWPVIDSRAHRLYSFAPRKFRESMLNTRGSGRSWARLLRVLGGTLEPTRTPYNNPTYIQAVNAGTARISSLADIRFLLLPDMRRALEGQSLALDQMAHWEACLGRVTEILEVSN